MVEEWIAYSYTRSSIPVTQDNLRIQFLSVEIFYKQKVCNVYEINIDKVCNSQQRKRRTIKSNLQNFYLLKNTSSCLHGSR